jgi:DNA-directed RNA polymerase specialized sigma24 family protein
MPLRVSSTLSLPRPLGSVPSRVFLFGLLLVTVALAPLGLPSSAVTTLVLLGVAMAFLAVASPWVREFEIDFAGLKTRLDLGDGDSKVLTGADLNALNQFAHLACGDRLLAREVVEKALAKSALHRAKDRNVHTVRRMIDLMDSAADRRWLRGEPQQASADPSGPESRQVIADLQLVALFPRICFLLHAELELTPAEVAFVVERSAGEVEQAIALARRAINLEGGELLDAGR